jgi:hypothetical protein
MSALDPSGLERYRAWIIATPRTFDRHGHRLRRPTDGLQDVGIRLGLRVATLNFTAKMVAPRAGLRNHRYRSKELHTPVPLERGCRFARVRP